MKTTNVLLVLTLVLLTGCFGKKGKLHFQEPKKPSIVDRVPQEEEPRPASSAFENLKATVLETNGCLKCHSGVSEEKNLANWIVPGNPEESKLFRVVESGMMPKRPYDVLTTAQLEVVRDYITNLVPKEQVTYKVLEREILGAKKCLDCHKSITGEEKLVEKWVTPGEPKTSKLFLKVADGTMPKNGKALDRAELDLVIEYIKNVKVPSVDESAPERAPTFEELKAEILVPMKCLGCHKNKDSEEALAAWIDPAGPATSKLLLRTADGTMPKKGTPLTSEQLKFVEDYIKAYLKK